MFRMFNEEFKKVIGMTMEETLTFIREEMETEPLEVHEADEYTDAYILVGRDEYNCLTIDFDENNKVVDVYEDCEE